MRHIPVNSSNIKEIGYDPDRREMNVRFHGGGSYTHVDVSPEQHSAFMSAGSHGKHYNQHFKGTAGYRGEPAAPAPTRPTGSAPINEEPPAKSIAEAMERFAKPAS